MTETHLQNAIETQKHMLEILIKMVFLSSSLHSQWWHQRLKSSSSKVVRKSKLNSETWGKHISGDVGLMTSDKDSQSSSCFYYISLNFFSSLKSFFPLLEMDMTSKSVCVRGGNMSFFQGSLRLNRRRNWLKTWMTYASRRFFFQCLYMVHWKLSFFGPILFLFAFRFFLFFLHIICNLWSMERLGISITGKYKFIFMAKLFLFHSEASKRREGEEV